jgi:carbon-monoxide dehydrogenase small subunit
MKRLINLRVNSEEYEVAVAPNRTLLEVLRELNFTGTKEGCDMGGCGACTVLLDGEPILSCLTLAIDVKDRDILTIEGLAQEGDLHPLQKAFVDHGAIQCGYCIPGTILAAKALLDKNPHPTKDEVKEGISGNLCRCTGYVKIIDAILSTTEKEA